MQHMVIPQLEETIYAAVKRGRDDAYWGGGGPPCWVSNRKRTSGQWSSQSSAWQAPGCRMCFNQFQDTETNDWKLAWEKELKHPDDWKGKPAAWYNSMYSHLHSATVKAVKERQPKPDYDGATLTLLQSRLERALYDQCKPNDHSRFLLLHKTNKLVTLGCFYCRMMSTLNYPELEPRDGNKLYLFFDTHLGGGIW